MRFHVFPRSWQGYQDSCHWALLLIQCLFSLQKFVVAMVIFSSFFFSLFVFFYTSLIAGDFFGSFGSVNICGGISLFVFVDDTISISWWIYCSLGVTISHISCQSCFDTSFEHHGLCVASAKFPTESDGVVRMLK